MDNIIGRLHHSSYLTKHNVQVLKGGTITAFKGIEEINAFIAYAHHTAYGAIDAFECTQTASEGRP